MRRPFVGTLAVLKRLIAFRRDFCIWLEAFFRNYSKTKKVFPYLGLYRFLYY